MKAAEKMFELYAQGHLGTPVNDPDTLAVSRRLDDYISAHTSGAVASELNTLAANYACRNLEQGFLAGYRIALALSSNGEL